MKRFSQFENLSSNPPLAPLISNDASLEALITRMAQGEAEAMAQLYDASIVRVYSLVRRFLPDDASAQDVTQEIYLQAWMHAARFDAQRGAAMGWLLNLARSRALDAWRKISSNPVLMQSDTADIAAEHWCDERQPADFLDALDQQTTLAQAIALLPPVTRQMLSLAFFFDMTHQEISNHLHMPLGTVKSSLRRALLAMREHLAQSGMSSAHLSALSLNLRA